MRDRITDLHREWRVDLCLIEDTSSGTGLIQILQEQTALDVVGDHPTDNKETRLSRQQGKLECGRLLLPKDAPWLPEFESELLAFPFDRHDDQVDALLLFLEWYTENESYLADTNVMPILLRKDGYDRYDRFGFDSYSY